MNMFTILIIILVLVIVGNLFKNKKDKGDKK